MKKILILFIIVLAIYLGFGYFSKYKNTQNESFNQKATEVEKRFSLNLGQKDARINELEQQLKEREEIYTILAGGDLMFDRGVEKKLKSLSKDYNFPLEKISDYLHSADYVFANLEGSLSDVGTDQGGKYSFRFDVPVAQALADAGIDMVSLANNHILDWGRDSLCATLGNLDAVNVKSVGAGCDRERAERVQIEQFGNTRIAFLAYTEFHPWAVARESRPGMSEYDIDKIIERVQTIKSKNTVDLVFVSMHWGEEYLDRAPERIVKIAHQLIDAGVDVIIGHHPHVDQEIEHYGDGWIIYSLGNFVFDQSWSENTMQGLLAEIQVQDKDVYDVVPKMIQLNKNYQPELI